MLILLFICHWHLQDFFWSVSKKSRVIQKLQRRRWKIKLTRTQIMRKRKRKMRNEIPEEEEEEEE